MKNCTGYTIINGEHQILYTAGLHHLSADSYRRLQVTNILTFYKETQSAGAKERRAEEKREIWEITGDFVAHRSSNPSISRPSLSG